MPQDKENSLLDAVRQRDKARVTALIAAGSNLEERSDSQSTPLILACVSDQFEIAELLLGAGASAMAHDQFGWTAGYAAQSSRLPETGPEGEARLRLIQALKAKGFPFPAPRPKDVRAAIAAGQWPPR